MKAKIKEKIKWGEVDFAICKPYPGYFKDDKKGFCSECGRKIVYRPYIPDDIKKVCLECVSKLK